MSPCGALGFLNGFSSESHRGPARCRALRLSSGSSSESASDKDEEDEEEKKEVSPSFRFGIALALGFTVLRYIVLLGLYGGMITVIYAGGPM